MPLHGEDVYAQVWSALPAGYPFADARRGRPAGWATLAGSVGLPMLLAISLAALAWALPGSGEPQALAALGLAGLAAALGASAVWAFAAAAQRRALELETLRAEQRALREELTALAHDLRAPLVTAHSYFELLADEAFGRLPSEAREAAKRGKVASERARDLADATLRRSLRAGGTRRPGRPAAVGVDLNALVGEVLVGLAVQLAATDAEIEVRDLPVAAGADRDALYGVFSALVEHALQYAPPGRKPRILVSGYEDGDYASVSVRDWGPGIAGREHERIFGEFERRSDTAAGDAPGAGLGLATVRRLVREQGGRVWIDPLVTDGLCVRVALPRPRG